MQSVASPQDSGQTESFIFRTDLDGKLDMCNDAFAKPVDTAAKGCWESPVHSCATLIRRMPSSSIFGSLCTLIVPGLAWR